MATTNFARAAGEGMMFELYLDKLGAVLLLLYVGSDCTPEEQCLLMGTPRCPFSFRWQR